RGRGLGFCGSPRCSHPRPPSGIKSLGPGLLAHVCLTNWWAPSGVKTPGSGIKPATLSNPSTILITKYCFTCVTSLLHCAEGGFDSRLLPCGRGQFFFSSTSTYSASITPSSFFSLAAPSDGPPDAAPASAPGCGCADLYMASASLCDAWVSRSRAEFKTAGSASAFSSAFLASPNADSTLPFSSPEILSPCSLSIFSTL